ncbi:MAG: DUF3500 domain-containing protein [Planctomycetales bacterium]|nr:DUF3500 domain-containing protein [Planctomycetales bacterium]
MRNLNRRDWLVTTGAASVSSLSLGTLATTAKAIESNSDSLPMQLYKSLSEQQRQKVCLPIDSPRRGYVSNWWYIHPDYRIPSTFDEQQQELIKQIFDSLHSEEHQDAVNKQVLIDQYGEQRNAPAAGFFGTPDDKDFEFIFTGHHVTRRCNAHSDKGLGFGGNPVFYGHYPHDVTNMRDNFNEAKDHPGNPYWYQGKLFNRFVQALDHKQQVQGLVASEPRGEEPETVIKKANRSAGLNCAELTSDQRQLLVDTMRGMLAMFRVDDVAATIRSIEENKVVDRLHVSWFSGKYDIGSDQFWDTWQIEGPDMVWYFRGFPHIHCYFHLKT